MQLADTRAAPAAPEVNAAELQQRTADLEAELLLAKAALNASRMEAGRLNVARSSASSSTVAVLVASAAAVGDEENHLDACLFL